MQILVTGGAGYIGAHTVKLLRERGYSVLVLDSLETGHRAAISDTPFVAGSTKDRALLRHIFDSQSIDAVIHFAAYKEPKVSLDDPGRYFDNNVVGTLTLLQEMQQADVKRLVFSSTCAVYGEPDQLPVSETNALRPQNPYGESKLMVEQMLRWFDTCHGMLSVSLRYFNAVGAALDGSIGEDPRATSNLMPMVLSAALAQRPAVKVFGTDYPTHDGTAIRDYIHVLDLADAHIRALEYLTAHRRSDVFNLGTSQGVSVQQVIDRACAISGVAIPVEYAPRRPGDPGAIWADNTKARTVLDWRPQYGLDDMIATAWRWHVTHPHGYD